MTESPQEKRNMGTAKISGMVLKLQRWVECDGPYVFSEYAYTVLQL